VRCLPSDDERSLGSLGVLESKIWEEEASIESDMDFSLGSAGAAKVTMGLIKHALEGLKDFKLRKTH